MGEASRLRVTFGAVLESVLAIRNVENALEVSQKREDGDVNSMFKLT